MLLLRWPSAQLAREKCDRHHTALDAPMLGAHSDESLNAGALFCDAQHNSDSDSSL